MLTPLPFVIVVAAGLIVGSSYCWARRQGLLAAGSAAERKPGTRRPSPPGITALILGLAVVSARLIRTMRA